MRRWRWYWLAFAAVFGAMAAQAADQCAPCDLDGNGSSTTVADYAVMIGAFGKSKGQPGYSEKADFDGNGAVTATDWGTFARFCPLR